MAKVESDFDLVEVGILGRVQVAPRSCNSDCKGPQIPRVTLPFGLPPILGSLHDDVERNLLHPEDLPIYDTDRAQQFWPRRMDAENLFSLDTCPVQTTIHVERDPTSGKLLSFKEDFILDTKINAQNSLSMRRPPGPESQDIKGSGSSYPFWPGGLEEPTLGDLKNIAKDTKDLFSELLTTPPGFEAGMDFTEGVEGENTGELSKKGDNQMRTSAPGIIKLSDILAQSEEFDFAEDDTSQNDISGTPAVAADDKPQVQRSESLEKLVEDSDSTSGKMPVPDTPAATPVTPKVEWAVKVDINKPVDDFHKRVPVMARVWPFELDTFQKQAVLHLEQHECVFVAAHTSAGKTVVAEYAIALSLRHLTKTIYTSPIKALSNQKFREFRNAFGDENVGLVTGDVQLNQTASCLIMTTEILRSMLYNGSDVIRDLEWVVFDEVHYINDTERGVVWEEVLIMLPEHVNIILLSATVPNTIEFADWIGRTKQKKIYVISTLKRPVPLEHYLYTGNSNKTSNEQFLLVDAKGSFLTQGYMKAVAAKKERASKASQNFGAKGTRGGHPQQDKNTWISLIDMLKKKDKLPVVSFIFSKKKIEENASMLHGVDLTNQSEKSRIHIFFHRCISRLKPSDQTLPQVKRMEDMLKRGLGVHHSGILPILKEVVEMLFQENLVKVLFATETFAMGVNMPARTVVFDTIRKHDGKGFRNLLAGEYIQMAGRAGRRGLDTTGTVIILCKGDVPETSELHKMMLGKPTKLESQFRLTYSMILNLLRVEQLKVEDMMKRSFSEFHMQRETPKHRADLEVLRHKVAEVKTIECYLCCEDLERYYQACQEFHKLRRHLQAIVLTHPTALKALAPGRVVIVDTEKVKNVLGIVLATTLQANKERKFTVLVMCEKTQHSTSEKESESSSDATQTLVTPVTKMSLFLPEGPCGHKLEMLSPEHIRVITTTTIKVEPEKIINDVKKREMLRFRDDPPGKSVSIATQELLRLAEANPSGLDGLDPVKDLHIRDIELVEQFRALKLEHDTFDQYHCIHCSKFTEHFDQMRSNMNLKEEFRRLQYLLSDASLSLLPEYDQRLQVLKKLKYVDEHGSVQLKGRVACEISNHELMITELVFENIFTDLHPADIAALLSGFVFQQKNCSEPNLTDTLERGRKQILQLKETIEHLQKDVGMQSTVGAERSDQIYFGLMEVVFEWARGMPFSEITTLTDVQEGIIVRSIQRLHEILRDVKGAARIIGDPVLFQKMAEAESLIKRDIVFAASLYTH